jgi:hypothetical protein
MFANRYAIWTDPETGQRPDEDVPLSALSTGGETGDFQPFNASEDNLREVLDTGLFSARGAARMGWAHQSYAEFLAADYLVTKQASADNILKILCHPGGSRCHGLHAPRPDHKTGRRKPTRHRRIDMGRTHLSLHQRLAPAG